MTQHEPVRVTIIVACRNEISHIRAFLDSLVAQDMHGISWEAIIADGMSDDGTMGVLQQYSERHPQLRIVPNPGLIVSTGLNAAIRAARGDIIMRMDAHTSYAPTYCRRCVEILKRTGADNVGGPARTKAHGVRARAVAAAYHSRFSTGGAGFHDVNYEGWVDTVPYGCWRKTTLERLGLFDETLVRNQDDELNLRLVRTGGRIWQSPDIISWYSPRPAVRDLFRQYLQYGFWKVAVIRKHRLPGSWRHLVPVAFVLSHVSLLGGTAIALASGASRFSFTLASLWLALVIVYAGASFFVSACIARRCGWATAPYLPVIFAAFHFSYGFGFLAGLLRAVLRPGKTLSTRSLFTTVTRRNVYPHEHA
jgi:succinoglycan biosynthesis protein ExoA